MERSDIAPGEPYQVRFGFTRKDLLLLPASIVVIAVGVLIFRRDPATAVGAIALGGAYVVARLANVTNRRIALRVDVDGVTLGMTPPWPSSKTAKVPWSDIEAIVLWTQRAGPNTIRYIGLQRRSGLAPLPGSARSRLLRRMISAMVSSTARHNRTSTQDQQDRKQQLRGLQETLDQGHPEADECHSAEWRWPRLVLRRPARRVMSGLPSGPT